MLVLRLQIFIIVKNSSFADVDFGINILRLLIISNELYANVGFTDEGKLMVENSAQTFSFTLKTK